MRSSRPEPSTRLVLAIATILILIGGGGFMVFVTRPPVVKFEVSIVADNGGSYPIELDGTVVGNTPMLLDEALLAAYTRRDPVGTWPPPVPPGYVDGGGGSSGISGLRSRIVATRRPTPARPTSS